MTLHLHGEYVDGCFRCDLSRDEMAGEAILDDINELVNRMVECRASLTYAKLNHGYALVRESE